MCNICPCFARSLPRSCRLCPFALHFPVFLSFRPFWGISAALLPRLRASLSPRICLPVIMLPPFRGSVCFFRSAAGEARHPLPRGTPPPLVGLSLLPDLCAPVPSLFSFRILDANKAAALPVPLCVLTLSPSAAAGSSPGLSSLPPSVGILLPSVCVHPLPSRVYIQGKQKRPPAVGAFLMVILWTRLPFSYLPTLPQAYIASGQASLASLPLPA